MRAGRAGSGWGEDGVGGEDFGFDAEGEGKELADDGPEAVADADAFDPGAVGGVGDGQDDGLERADDGVDGCQEEIQEAVLRRGRGGVRHGLIGPYSLV